jgi:hypothetical protein
MILLENINCISWPFKMGNENINAGNIFSAALDSRTNTPCLKKIHNEITYRKV